MRDISGQAADKEFLRSIADNGYELPEDIDAFTFARALLPNFASLDGEMRDELSYMILASGIVDKHKLDKEQLKTLLSTVLDADHLFFHIGENETDTVFMRSFSNLIIAAILYSDAKKPELSETMIQQTKAALLRYAQEERDWRGYIEGKGWAHAMAHLADALDECAQSRTMTMDDRKEIMEIICALARLSVPLYHEEDVRLATVAYHVILGKQADDEFLNSWVEACFVPRDSDVVSWTRGANAKNFLRSLYFLLYWAAAAPVLTEHISSVLKRQDDVYIEIK